VPLEPLKRPIPEMIPIVIDSVPPYRHLQHEPCTVSEANERGWPVQRISEPARRQGYASECYPLDSHDKAKAE
jgi:hypothetical protein